MIFLGELKKANLNKRIIAFAIDYIVLAVTQYFVGLLLSVLLNILKIDSSIILIVVKAFTVINICIFFFKDSINGQSIGRKAVGIAVRDKNNVENTPSILRLALRNLTLIILPFELLVLILSDEKMIRFGDSLLNTEVIDLEIKRNFSII